MEVIAMKNTTWLFALLACSGVYTALGQAADGSVAGQGVVTIARPAECLRLQVDLIAKDKDPRQAAAKLKQLEEAASAKLTELGALKGTIQFAEPALGGPEFSAPSPFEAALGTRGQPDEDELAKMPATFTVRLTADWALSAADPAERLIAVHELKLRIRQADLGGRKHAQTEEDEEETEEPGGAFAAAMAAAGIPPGKPGQAKFLFVWKLSREEQAQATAEAFGKAKAQADRLAAAAGHRLGRLRSVDLGTGAVPGQQPDFTEVYRKMLGAETEQPAADEGEAVGAQPARVEHKITVNAAFELVGPPGA
jgi:uncharacterized protein YggE